MQISAITNIGSFYKKVKCHRPFFSASGDARCGGVTWSGFVYLFTSDSNDAFCLNNFAVSDCKFGTSDCNHVFHDCK